MICIPAGSFLMGNSSVGDDATFTSSKEFPQHSVTLSGYYIGKYQVTRGEYRAFMNAGGYSTQSYWSDEGWGWKVSKSRTEPSYWAAEQHWGDLFTQTDNHPVIGVTYYEAEAFCNWVGGHLPTEAQWEKAARWTGSHANVYPWGDVWDESRLAPLGPGLITPRPVGSYPAGASPYGCMDMSGNVLEWCKDWFGDTYYSESPTSDPQGPASGSTCRVLRGGGWGNSIPYRRCAYRLYSNPDSDEFYFFGFRFAR